MEWKENLSEELQGSLSKFNSVEDLAKSYLNIEKMNGNSVRAPGPDATPEARAENYQKVMNLMPELMVRPNLDDSVQMAAYNASIGVPDNLDGYDPGENTLGEAVLSELKTLAQDTGMTKTQFKAYAQRMNEMQAQTQQNNDDVLLAQNAELSGIWGLATQDRVKVVEKHLADNNLGTLANYTPDQIQGHYGVAVSLVGQAQAHNQPVTTTALAPDEAKSQLNELRNNPDFRDAQTNPVNHKRLVMKQIDLMKAANPSEYS